MSRALVLAFLIALFAHPFFARAHQGPASYASVHVQVAYANISMFDTEQAAQKHCPSDTVVWLNTNSGIYHLKGERWYGRTKHGAYVCKKEADAFGYRETRNGQ
jgi:hypothetical protein